MINKVRDFIIKEPIGTGSYGTVYTCYRQNDKKNLLVIKQISLFGMDDTQIAEVKNEATLLSKMNHENIVKYYDSFVENNNWFIVMEYCNGGDLYNYLKKNKTPLKEAQIFSIFIQICNGLNYIHNVKVIHRDLKSLNIFLTKDFNVRIGDLGVAKILSQTGHAKTFIGTPYYLPPEICKEEPLIVNKIQRKSGRLVTWYNSLRNDCQKVPFQRH